MENRYQKLAHKYNNIINQKSLYDPQISALIFFPLFGFYSYKIFKAMNNQRLTRNIKNMIMKSIPIETNLQRNTNNSLVYTYGNVVYKNQQIAKDNLFKISSSSLDQLGLYRRVEIYHNQSMNHKFNCQWYDSRILESNLKFSDQQFLTSEVTTNGDIFLEKLKLSTQLLIQLSENNLAQKLIDVDHFKNLIEEIESRRKQQNISYNNESEVIQNDLEKLILSGRHVEINEDFIYIKQNKEKMSKGDIRISFHEIQKIANATILAIEEQNSFQAFSKSNSQEKIEYSINGEKGYSYISTFSFINKGFVDYKDLISSLKQASNSKINSEYKQILIYGIIISSLYFYFELVTDSNLYDINNRKIISSYIYDLQNNSGNTDISQNYFDFDRKNLEAVLLVSSVHFVSLQALCYHIIGFPLFFEFGLITFLLEKSSSYTELIRNFKSDLEEIRIIKKENSFEKYQEMLNRQSKQQPQEKTTSSILEFLSNLKQYFPQK